VKVFDEIIRVSAMNGREESAESTKTIGDQRAANRSAAKEAGGRIGRSFKLLDQSGRTIHKTGVYDELLQRVVDGKADGVVVAYGDRLTRNWRAVGAFYDKLEDAGAEVIIAGMPGVDYRTATGRVMTGMMAVVSDMVGYQAVDRGNRLADQAFADGIPPVVPYGYRRNLLDDVKALPDKPEKALVPDDPSHCAACASGPRSCDRVHTAPIVRRIFELRDAGRSWAKIASTLNDAGVPSPSGGHWVHGTLGSMIRNEAYVGTFVLGKRRRENVWTALVGKALFRRVRQARKVTPSGNYAGGIAQGILVCSGCDQPLSVRGLHPTHRSKTARGSQTYGCRRSSREGSCPRPVYVSKDRADAFVERELRAVLKHAKVGIVATSRDLENRRRAWEDAREETAAFVENVSARDPHFARGKAKREADEQRAREAYELLAAQAEEAEQIPSPSAFDDLDLDGQRHVARLLIDRVVVSPPLSRSRFANVEDRFGRPIWKRAAQ